MTTPPASSPAPEDATAARAAALRINDVLSPSAIDDLLAEADAQGLSIDGPDGLLGRMTKAVLERALDAEMAEHLGYEAGDPAGRDGGNSRNGHGRKTVHATVGPVRLTVPRDREGSFTPGIVLKRKRRPGNVEDMIISLYARGMSTRDITAHLHEVYGTTVSAATISRVTDIVADEVALWQSRPVDAVYPILYIDALRIKIRDAGVVANKAAHLVVGVDMEGRKQVLGVWIQQTEGAKFWAGVLTELRNRGLRDALIVCCDGLTGLPAAVNSVWPQAVVQTCVIHLIRASMRYVSWWGSASVPSPSLPPPGGHQAQNDHERGGRPGLATDVAARTGESRRTRREDATNSREPGRATTTATAAGRMVRMRSCRGAAQVAGHAGRLVDRRTGLAQHVDGRRRDRGAVRNADVNNDPGGRSQIVNRTRAIPGGPAGGRCPHDRRGGRLTGDLDDLDALTRYAREADGVVHLAFSNDVPDLEGSIAEEGLAMDTIGAAPQGSGKPFAIVSGTTFATVRPATEQDAAGSIDVMHALVEDAASTSSARALRSAVGRFSS